jgi:glyoxylase I family protein
MINKLLHVSIIVSDLGRARDFYEGMLGLQASNTRPDMSFDGVWYEIGEQQIHLLALPNPDPVNGRPTHGGRDRHVALTVDDLVELTNVLNQANIPYTLSQSGRVALFCRDPDGNALEFIQDVLQ